MYKSKHVFSKTHVTVAICPPEIPHGPVSDLTRASAARGRGPTAGHIVRAAVLYSYIQRTLGAELAFTIRSYCVCYPGHTDECRHHKLRLFT